MEKKTLIYFDTCVLNKLAYIENYDHILKKLTTYNYKICISEVNILEILRDIKDEFNIDKIVTMLQETGELYLLPSINAIIEAFIKKEDICLELNNMNKVIMEVLSDKERIFEVEDKQNLYKLRDFYKFFRNTLKTIKKCEGCEEQLCSERVSYAAKLFAGILMSYDIYHNENVKLLKEINVNSDEELEEYINKNYEYLIENDISPFRNMGRMAILQKRTNNGTFNDCIQTVYLHFVDYIISDDEHFKANLNNCLTFEELMENLNIKIEWQK